MIEDDSAGGDHSREILCDPTRPQMSNGPIKLALIQKPGSAAWRFNSLSMIYLRDRIERYTEFQIELIDGGAGVSLAEERLLEVPVIFVNRAPEESDGGPLARYLLAGGFALVPCLRSSASVCGNRTYLPIASRTYDICHHPSPLLQIKA